MIDENINDGDIVLVRHQATAANGEKVVALLDNTDVTLKTFFQERGRSASSRRTKRWSPSSSAAAIPVSPFKAL